MNKTAIAKAVVNNATGFALGSAARNIFRNNVPHTNNPVLDILVDASVLIGAWAVSGTVAAPVQKHTDAEIDRIADALQKFNKN